MTATPQEGALEAVAALENLESALAKVAQNKGAPGVDGQTVEQAVRNKDVLLPALADALLTGTYQPGDIRRAWIPKSSGGRRGLGIPNVVDRVVQQALLQYLEPIFEPTFHPSSHGFRPGRSCHTAIAEASGYVAEEKRFFVVDVDLKSFFDHVNHDRLVAKLGQRVKDRRILRLMSKMVKARVVLPDGVRIETTEGVPQGGPLSPLLSNIVLDELDRELERRGHRFVRYADDCNIYVRSERSGLRAMASIRSFIERRLRLQVNEKKSAVARARSRHFLGFRVSGTRKGPAAIRLSSRSIDRIRARIAVLTPRNSGRALTDTISTLNRYLKGWMGFFHICTQQENRMLRTLDAHARRRLRAIIVRQKKRARHLFRHLVQRGVSRASAHRTAFSRRGVWWQSRSKGMHLAYPNDWFTTVGLVTLEARWQTHRVREAVDPG